MDSENSSCGFGTTNSNAVTNVTMNEFGFNKPSWTLELILSVSVGAIGIITNFSVLATILFNRHLRTPFTVYLINLLTINCLYFAIQVPLATLHSLYPRRWLGDDICTLYSYVSFATEADIFNSHALITANRIWAITFPISYKTLHSKRFAVLACLAVGAYVNLMTLPLVIRDALYFRRDIEIFDCDLNVDAQYSLRLLHHFLVNDAPAAFVVGAYPFLWFKRRERLNQQNQLAARPAPAQRMTQRENVFTVNGARNVSHERRVVTEPSYAFMVLTFLTVNVVVCWAPIQVYQGLRLLGIMIGPREHSVIITIGYILLGLAPVLDPLFFTVALKDLRTAYLTMFMNRKIDQRMQLNKAVSSTNDDE